MRIGDVVELIDESQWSGKYSGRMKVVAVSSLKGDNIATCIHPIEGEGSFVFEDLVVMEEADD
jgi:hypothetical protein